LFANADEPAHYSFMSSHANERTRTRASLINRLPNLDDQSSWRDFDNTYRKLIYGVARNAGLTHTEAEDVVQETMASVAKHMPTFKYDPAIGSFKAWLLIKTRWCIIAQFRKRASFIEHRPLHKDTPNTGTGTVEKVPDPAPQVLDTMWEAEQETHLLNAAIAKVKRRLDPQKYQIFDFYVNKEWPPEKVAAQFGVSVDQVYLTKHRVTDAIREEVFGKKSGGSKRK
jgi:RNA polymerase sigma factor (sigma-70 family)